MALYLHTDNTTAGTTANIVWYGWCEATDSAATTMSTAASTWITWTTAGTTAGNATGINAVWVQWTAVGTTLVTAPATYQPAVDRRTPEQIAAANEAWKQKQAADAEQRRKAIVCARALLLAMLDHHQREQLQRDLFFEVIARHSKRRYRIRQGTHGNVKLLDDAGREVVSYCGQPLGVPEDDAMLAQKLQIEYDEDEYLKRANASPEVSPLSARLDVVHGRRSDHAGVCDLRGGE